MTTYQITSGDGSDFGRYEGETAEAAWAAMVEDSGGPSTDSDGAPLEGRFEDWTVREVATERVEE